MSKLSANTLFHLTSKAALINILDTGFRPTFCKEHGPSEQLNVSYTHIPMVCFCDIPLSMLDRHLNGYEWIHKGQKQSFKGYGRFGLGMSKEWAVSKSLNPVAYTNRTSVFYAGMHESNYTLGYVGQDFYDYFESLKGTLMSSGPNKYHLNKMQMFVDQFRKALFFTGLSFSYIKPYKSAVTGQNYYDEKEWRFVPMYIEKNEFGTDDIKVPTVNEKTSDYQSLIDKFKIMINEKYMLKFDPIHIRYIIVEDDKDIKDIVQKMESLPNKYSELDRNRLISRVITHEQLQEDF